MVEFKDVEAARGRVFGAVKKTPCEPSQELSALVGANVSLKLENLQHTGSYKERGALNRLMRLSDDERARGVIAASAGNHAQGVAFHASRLGIASTIVMPVGTPLIKITRTQEFGAKVVLFGEDYDSAYAHARQLQDEQQLTFIHAYDDDDVIAGQGTIGLEIIEQNPYAEVIVVPVGGGGLIAGLSVAMKKVNPSVRIIGVEAAVIPAMRAALDAGGPTVIDGAQTIADGIAVREVGKRPFEAIAGRVDDVVTISEEDIASAILYLLEREKTVAEGAGAISVAALLSGAVSDIAGKNVVAVVSGGNIDVNIVSRIIERGLVASGRLERLVVTVNDQPGTLARMLNFVSEMAANVVEVHHQRAFTGGSVKRVEINLVIESKGHAHVDRVVQRLMSEGYTVSRR